MARLARRTGVGGFVRNDSEGVWIEVEGQAGAIDSFVASVWRDAPRLARIDSVEVAELAARGESEFRIVESVSVSSARPRALVPADAATCSACLRELFDPADRRYRYPFINCTDCGPRFTIVTDLPYDRAATTMRAFRMCAACAAEYEAPGDRRYHAEPNACPSCGPQLALFERGQPVARGDEAVRTAAERLGKGAIVALKGLGGYQLAVVAGDAGAVARLRDRKHRPHKPLALMARDVSTVERVARLDAIALEALQSPAAPIVLLPSRGAPDVVPGVAPGLGELGVMLPATPLHHLLLRDGPELLVVTSGNRAEEPIAIDERALAYALSSIADVALVHDRPIHTRADDSVVRIVRGAAQPVRRARGLVPDAISLGAAGPSVLAVGPHLKSTVCLTRESEAFVSQHIGDLSGLETRAFFEETIAKLARLLGVRPEVVGHDLHPDYASTAWATSCGLPAIGVQHHHAHVAACMTEHAWTGPVIGVAFDGTGCGPAGELWGGEFLLADLGGFRRLGHLRALALVGGEAAIREPWRLALAAWTDAGEPSDQLVTRGRGRADVERLLGRGATTVAATGAGRWFDAFSAILRVREAITYEGQAAIELESLAAGGADARAYPFQLDDADPFVVDLRPAVRAVAADLRAQVRPADVALRVHGTLAAAILGAARRVRDAHGVNAVALSGGCFQNRILTERACDLLDADGFRVLVHRRVPPNDGGVALGQAAVARRVWMDGRIAERRSVGVPCDPG